MDPNEALRRIRELLAHDNGTADEWIELIELAQGLDSWLSKGGFRPRAWSAARTFSGQRVGQVDFDLLPNGLTQCPLSPTPHTILLVDDHGHTDPGGPLSGMPDPLGPPNPAHGELPTPRWAETTDTLTGLSREITELLHGPTNPPAAVALALRLQRFVIASPVSVDSDTVRNLLVRCARNIDPRCPADVGEARRIIDAAALHGASRRG